jgi:hypothetical protein
MLIELEETEYKFWKAVDTELSKRRQLGSSNIAEFRRYADLLTCYLLDITV